MRRRASARHVVERLHVVQPIGDLHQDHAQVARRGQDQLAEGLGLGMIAPDVLVLADLGDAVDQLGDLLAQRRGEVLAGGAGVLQHVVEQRDLDAGGVEAEVGEQPGDRQRMAEVGLARAPFLSAVGGFGVVVDGAQPALVVVAPVRFQPLEQVGETDVAPRLARRLDVALERKGR